MRCLIIYSLRFLPFFSQKYIPFWSLMNHCQRTDYRVPVPVLGAVGSVSGLLELSEFVFLLTPQAPLMPGSGVVRS